MKVTRNTQDILIVEDRPILVAGLLAFFFIGAVAGSLGALSSGELVAALVLLFSTVFVGLFIFAFVRRVQLIFNRPQNTLTFRKRSLQGYSEVVHPLNELSHAVTEGSETKRSVLIFKKGMSAGEHPVTGYLTDGKGPQRITDAINAWLKDAAAVDSKGSNT
ncbi:hypothetical protein [Planktotalea sp.]|uniref:hypothetical protein n=1 Tax=Planktotalea sp. TaxID=2029877 RepID=UPI0032978C87